MNKTTVLACNNLRKTFIDGSQQVRVLKNINLSVQHGETIAILGASGSGKSTLLHLLGGLDIASEGEVYWQGQSIQQLPEKKRCQLRNRYLGFVYQFHHLLPEFTAIENVAMPLLIRQENPEDALAQAALVLDQVGLSARKTHRTTQLSGGERQRVAIARALVGKPTCVLADEPTGNLDEQTAQHIVDMMLQLQADIQTSFIVVTHNLQLAKRFAASYSLNHGELVATSR